MLTNIELYTDRLKLRPMINDDADYVVSWRNQDRIKEVLENQTDEKLTIENHLKWFESTREERIDYVVMLRESNIPIGVWSFKNFKGILPGKVMEQGRYIGDQSALGKGYAKEASKCWTFFGFEILKLDAIVSIHVKSNYAPQKINLGIGFDYIESPKNDLGRDFVAMFLTHEKYLKTPKSSWGVEKISTNLGEVL